jgi:hypothetical protein
LSDDHHHLDPSVHSIQLRAHRLWHVHSSYHREHHDSIDHDGCSAADYHFA